MADEKEKNIRKKFVPPETSVGDAAHQVVRAAVSSVPVVGGAATELLNALVTPVLDRRRREWMDEVAEALRALEAEKRLKVEDLKDNDVFVDTVLQATLIAIRTSQEEKRQALRNAVLNSVLEDAPPLSLQQMFLNWIDAFTTWHIKLLDLMDDPVARTNDLGKPPVNAPMGSLTQVVVNAYPELRQHDAFYKQVWADLWSRGLVNTEELHGMMTGQGMRERRTSQIGQQFLDFIREP